MTEFGKPKGLSRGKDSPLRAIQRKLNGNYFAMAWVSSQPQLISFWWLTA